VCGKPLIPSAVGAVVTRGRGLNNRGQTTIILLLKLPMAWIARTEAEGLSAIEGCIAVWLRGGSL